MIADIGTAVLLTLSLYLVIVYTLELMQKFGWDIDARQVRQSFLADPWNSQSSWITLMAITNLLPTLAHLVSLLMAVFHGVFIRRSRWDEITKWCDMLLNGERLPSKNCARNLYNYLVIDRIMGGAFVLVIVVALYPALQLGIWNLMRLFL